jgi:hypothetical protein
LRESGKAKRGRLTWAMSWRWLSYLRSARRFQRRCSAGNSARSRGKRPRNDLGNDALVWLTGANPRTTGKHGPPREEPERQAWTAGGTAEEMRLGLRRAGWVRISQYAWSGQQPPTTGTAEGSRAKRDRPPGRRMPCGLRCGAQTHGEPDARAFHRPLQAAEGLSPRGRPASGQRSARHRF